MCVVAHCRCGRCGAQSVAELYQLMPPAGSIMTCLVVDCMSNTCFVCGVAAVGLLLLVSFGGPADGVCMWFRAVTAAAGPCGGHQLHLSQHD